ncbi:hypothetical protein QUF56_03125 [Ureibacillus composti]|nr:hypothetical protein [Ureibacillus composti]
MNDKTFLLNMYAMLNKMQAQLNQCKSYLENELDEKGYDYSTMLEDYDVAGFDQDELFNEKTS